MKKLLAITAALLLITGLLWLASSWFIGLQTERWVRQQLEQSAAPAPLLLPDESGASFRPHSLPPSLLSLPQTLQSYQRSWLRSTVITELDVSQTILGEWVDDLQLVHQIDHGPVFWKPVLRPALQTGLVYWQTTLKTTALDEGVQEWLHKAFNADQPLQAKMLVGFDQQAHYQVKLKPVQTVLNDGIDELKTRWSEVVLNGQLNLADQQTVTGNPIAIKVADWEIANDELIITLPELNLHTALKPSGRAGETEASGKLEFSAQRIAVQLVNKPEVSHFNLEGESVTQLQADQRNGHFRLTLDQFDGVPYPINRLNFALNYGGLNQTALTAIDQLQTRMRDLQAQLGWSDEDIELPAVRREVFQLELQLKEQAARLLDTLFQQALQPEKTTLNYQLTVKTAKGDIEHTLDMRYAGNEQRIELSDLPELTVTDWLKLWRGDITLNAQQATVVPGVKLLLFHPLAKRGLVIDNERYQMALSLLDDNVRLNGQLLDYSELPGRFVPFAIQPQFEVSDTAKVPDDVWTLIKKEGLTGEVIASLERRGDISEETMELLRQLQKTAGVLKEAD